MKIFLSGAHGSACSMIKSQMTKVFELDSRTNTCHQSWTAQRTTAGDSIQFFHYTDPAYIQSQFQPDQTIWLRVAEENIVQLCQRIVVLDFMYTNDPAWMAKDHCWTPEKHARIAGPSWPAYSTNIDDYPDWCLNELCQIAYDRTLPWIRHNSSFDWEISSDELFSFRDPSKLRQVLAQFGCGLNHDFLYTWRMKNFLLWQQYKHMFNWSPDHNPLQQ
jgi:hypothetical protein